MYRPVCGIKVTEDEAQIQRIAPETAVSIRREWGDLYTSGRRPREKGRSLMYQSRSDNRGVP